MSYQALARKWRPRTFADVVGQEHVVQALSNALDRDQVHHAFLFSGTRGVGKTTLARIFAKALNCERGVSSNPCNECANCEAIDNASFIDLIEVDAASRTKVDDTRELLDNVQYTPTSGRYKVYLIDEVHMLSAHSFNALLKTLEEPPPHVKFLLATTDPQKLPVTVLSRCLQFNLKALQPEQIQAQLQIILQAEGVDAEPGAIQSLARAADGSLRDGLSLLDQALAYGGGCLEQSMVRSMLGTIEDDVVEKIIRALIDVDAGALLQIAADMADRRDDYAQALDEILAQLYNLSLYQLSPQSLIAKQAEQPWHAEMSPRVSTEDLQLFYQIGLIGKRDLPLAPDPRTGFEMVLIRMLAFKPAQGSDAAVADPDDRAPALNLAPGGEQGSHSAPGDVAQTRSVDQARGYAHTDNWSRIVEELPINGLVKELAMNLGLQNEADGAMFFHLDPSHEHLLNPARVESIAGGLRKLGREISINVKITKSEMETPAQHRQRQLEQRQRAAEQAIAEDPNVRAIQEKFGATIIKKSIRVRD